MNRFVVTVDGVDGCGKSTFARRLHDALAAGGLAAVVARVDDYRQEVTWGGDEATTYYERYFALAALAEVATRFMAGAGRLDLASFDGLGGRALAPREVEVPPAAVLLMEGVFIRRIPLAVPAVHIYLAVPREVAARRLVTRDIARGRAPDEVEHRLRVRYEPGQARYHQEEHPRPRADLVLDNTHPEAARLLGLRPRHLPPSLQHALERLQPGLFAGATMGPGAGGHG